MSDQTAASGPAPAASPAASEPSHYEMVLARPYPVLNTGVVVPAGRVTVIAAVADTIPAGIVISKSPAVA